MSRFKVEDMSCGHLEKAITADQFSFKKKSVIILRR